MNLFLKGEGGRMHKSSSHINTVSLMYQSLMGRIQCVPPSIKTPPPTRAGSHLQLPRHTSSPRKFSLEVREREREEGAYLCSGLVCSIVVSLTVPSSPSS